MYKQTTPVQSDERGQIYLNHYFSVEFLYGMH